MDGGGGSHKGFWGGGVGNMNSKSMIQHVLEKTKGGGKSGFQDYLQGKGFGNVTAVSGLVGRGGERGGGMKTFESSSVDHYSRGLKGGVSGIGGSNYKGSKRKRVVDYKFQERMGNLARSGMEKEQSSGLNGYIKH